MDFIYEGFACVSANADGEVVFSRNGGEIRVDCVDVSRGQFIPMRRYTISLIMGIDPSGNTFLMKSFMVDKFNNFIVSLVSSNSQCKLEIKMPLDSYKKEDMESFSINKKYSVKIE